MSLIIIYDLRKNKTPDKFFPRKSRICQELKIYFQMFMKKMEEFRLDHGRIEERVVDVLPASLLPKKMLDRWIGLEDGCIVQYLTRCTNKKTGESTTQIKRAVSSVRWDNENAELVLATALRQRWCIEMDPGCGVPPGSHPVQERQISLYENVAQ